MTTIAHIINPAKVKPGTDLHYTQPIVFEAIRKAVEFSGRKNDIRLLTAQFDEDREIIPEFFQKTYDLQRSVLDIQKFKSSDKKLPLIADIVERLKEAPTVDYYIYTNSDIIPLPQFYETIFQLIDEGYDAFAINRRRIPTKYRSVKDLPFIYSMVGKSHPGFDCFVFKKTMLTDLVLGSICVGVPFLEATLLHNLCAFSQNFKLVDDWHLTTHIGMQVMPKRNKELYWHNRNEFNQILKKIKPRIKNKNYPYSRHFLLKRTLKRALNPSTFTKLALELEAKSATDKLSYLWNEMRFGALRKD